MRWGVHLPVAGKGASPGIILQVAVEAERIGLDSVWSWERLMRVRRDVRAIVKHVVERDILHSVVNRYSRQPHLADRSRRVLHRVVKGPLLPSRCPVYTEDTIRVRPAEQPLRTGSSTVCLRCRRGVLRL
jgi:hypothetical protein